MDPPALFLPYNNILALPTLTLTPLSAVPSPLFLSYPHPSFCRNLTTPPAVLHYVNVPAKVHYYPSCLSVSITNNRYLSSSPLPVEAGARLRCLALVVYKPRFRTQSWITTPVFGSGWHRACRSWTRVYILGHRDMLEHNLAVYSIILAFDNSVQILDQNKRCFCEIAVKTIKSVTNVVMFCLLPVHGVTKEYSVTSPG